MNYPDKASTSELTPELTPNPTELNTLKLTNVHIKKSNHKISPLKLCENFVNKIVKKEKKNKWRNTY